MTEHLIVFAGEALCSVRFCMGGAEVLLGGCGVVERESSIRGSWR